MNKQQLVDAIAEETSLSKASAEKAVEALGKILRDELRKGGEVALYGVGSFRVTQRAARTSRNPRTGAELKIPAKKAPQFRAAKALKDAVAG